MNVLVLGAGVSGRAAAGLATRLGHHTTVHEPAPSGAGSLRDVADVVEGPWTPALLDGVDLVVASPGIPEHAPPITDSLGAGVPVVSELEFAARHLDAPYAAVTGTNGKTTVTETTAAMLTASGMRACAAGNVGLALSDVALDPWDAVVVEASSFQLRFVDRFHPAAAAILNIADDHLDWHGTTEAYAAAKARIHENQDLTDIVVYDVDDPGATAAIATAPSRRIPVSGTHVPTGGSGPDGTELVIGAHRIPNPGFDPVWTLDLAVSATLAIHLGADAGAVAGVVEDFQPSAHRRTLVALVDGVSWIDDSKATNPHAAVAAAGAYPSVVLIAGGRNKGLDLTPILGVPTLRHVVAIGEAAGELAAAGGSLVTVAAGMDDAVDIAHRMARPGDTVLLAPGCASFDMFASYGERGDVFAATVRRRLGDHHAAQ